MQPTYRGDGAPDRTGPLFFAPYYAALCIDIDLAWIGRHSEAEGSARQSQQGQCLFGRLLMLVERSFALSIAGPHIDAHPAFHPNIHH